MATYKGDLQSRQSDEQYYAYRALSQMLGREPTDSELAQATVAYQGGDRNIPNVAGGDAFVANFVKTIQAQDPAAQQQAAAESSMGGSQYIEEQFKNLMPTLQKNFLDPLNAAIEAQRGSQKGINEDYMNQLMGIGNTQNDLLGQRMQSQRDQLMGQLTTGPEGEAFRQKYNNLGLLNSGAFNQGLSNQFGNLASQQQQDILNLGIDQQNKLTNAAGAGYGIQSDLALGGLNAQKNAMQLPINQGLGQFAQGQSQGNSLANSLMQRGFDVSDFSQQALLAGNLSQGQGPGTLDYINAAFNGAGNLGQAAGGAKTATSYVCKELIKRKLLCESDMDDFHVHIMPAMFKKGRAFWKYAMDGFRLVNAVNLRGLDWAVFKPLLFDRVMEEPDPCKAVDLYADACHQLCISSDRSLWDSRVYRTSVFDSLPFIPLLFAYQPFREALAKCIRIKMAIVYDKPRCGVHR